MINNDNGQAGRGMANVLKFTEIITQQENAGDMGHNRSLIDMIIIGEQLARFEQNIESAQALVKAKPRAEETAKDATIASPLRDNKSLRQEQRSQNKPLHYSNLRMQTVAQMSQPYDQEDYNEVPFSHETVALVASYPNAGGRGAGYNSGRGAGTSSRSPAKKGAKDKGGPWTTPDAVSVTAAGEEAKEAAQPVSMPCLHQLARGTTTVGLPTYAPVRHLRSTWATRMVTVGLQQPGLPRISCWTSGC